MVRERKKDSDNIFKKSKFKLLQNDTGFFKQTYAIAFWAIWNDIF